MLNLTVMRYQVHPFLRCISGKYRLPGTTVYTTPPWGGFTKLDCLYNQEGAHTERCVFGELRTYWRDVSTADFFGTDTIPAAVEMSSMENRPPGDVTHTVVYRCRVRRHRENVCLIAYLLGLLTDDVEPCTIVSLGYT